MSLLFVSLTAASSRTASTVDRVGGLVVNRICRDHSRCRRFSTDEALMRGRPGLAREYKAALESHGQDESNCIAFLAPKPSVGKAKLKVIVVGNGHSS